jgi:hypothetical protein
MGMKNQRKILFQTVSEEEVVQKETGEKGAIYSRTKRVPFS